MWHGPTKLDQTSNTTRIRGGPTELAKLIDGGIQSDTSCDDVGIGVMVEDGAGVGVHRMEAKVTTSPLVDALAADRVGCGRGTYQTSLSRQQVARVIEHTATAVVRHVTRQGVFADVYEASDFVAGEMTVWTGRAASRGRRGGHGLGRKRPQFSANEAAKDFTYIDGLMAVTSAHRCRLGEGAAGARANENP